MTLNEPVWFNDARQTPKWARGMKLIYLGALTGTRIKVKIAAGQVGEGRVYAADRRIITDVNPHAGYTAPEIKATEFVATETHVGLPKVAPIARKAASLADILGVV